MQQFKILLTVMAITAMACPAVCAVDSREAHLPPSITVDGTGHAYAKPDLVTVSVGVVTQASTAAKALAGNNEAMSTLLKMISAQGIADRDVQTSQFSIMPEYTNSSIGKSPRISDYRVSNDVRIRVRKIPQLGSLLDAVVESGANNVNGVSFSIENPSELMDDARKKAIEDARRKATVYAEASGVHLGKVLYVTEGGAPGPIRPMVYATRSSVGAVPIASGEEDLTVSASVVFAIE